MFWNAFKVTLGVVVAILGVYVLSLVLLIAWADGWFARNTWVLGIVGIVAIRALVEGWRSVRQAHARAANAKLN